MKNKLLSYSLSLYPVIITLLIFFTFPPYKAAAQKKSDNKMPEFNVSFSLATIYDDNILKYSDKYIDRFLHNQDSGRFHIDTYDDVILYPSLQITASYRIFGKMKSELDFDYLPRFYVVNDIKNWSYLSVGFRQYLTKRASFKLIYSYIPNFYIRHFRDDDWVEVYGYTPETYQPMGFSKDYYGFWIQNMFFKNSTVRFSMYYSQYYYNRHFTEYDCDDLFFGLKLYQEVHEKLRLELGYEFTSSDAKGYDEPGETRENSDEADASYYENGMVAKLIWKMPRFFNHSHTLEGEGAYQKRYYTSEHYLELDPLHAGRSDDNVQLSLTYEVKLYKSLELSAFYYWFYRDSSTSAEQNEEYVSDEKDYRQNQVGISLKYGLKF
jgi:hypothetical protein